MKTDHDELIQLGETLCSLRYSDAPHYFHDMDAIIRSRIGADLADPRVHPVEIEQLVDLLDRLRAHSSPAIGFPSCPGSSFTRI